MKSIDLSRTQIELQQMELNFNARIFTSIIRSRYYSTKITASFLKFGLLSFFHACTSAVSENESRLQAGTPHVCFVIRENLTGRQQDSHSGKIPTCLFEIQHFGPDRCSSCVNVQTLTNKKKKHESTGDKTIQIHMKSLEIQNEAPSTSCHMPPSLTRRSPPPMWEGLVGASFWISVHFHWIGVNVLHVDLHFHSYYLQGISTGQVLVTWVAVMFQHLMM